MFLNVFFHFSRPFSRFDECDGMVEKAKTEDIIKGLYDLAHKLDVISDIIFTLINTKMDMSQNNISDAIFVMSTSLIVDQLLS